MLCLRQRLGFFIIAGLAMTAISRPASAKTVMTPFGAADDSCVHETPKGAGIDVQTGDVRLNGKIVDHFAPCSVSWQLDLPERKSDRTEVPAPGSGWFAWSDAQEPTISGTKYPFDSAYSYLTVPTKPSPPSGDSPLEYYFMSLENNQGLSSNGTDCGSNIAIIQPVLQYGTNSGVGGGAYWSMAAYEVYGCSGSACQTGCSVGHSPYETIAAGDEIYGQIWQTASNLDEWEIRWDDWTSSTYTYNTIYNIPNSWPKFGSFQGGVNEMYNLGSCQDLSTDNSLTFNNDGVYVADPSWNSNYEVDIYGNNLLSWQGWHNTSLGCTPSVSIDTSNTDNSTLTWVE